MGLTQAEVAEYFDISSVSVSEWERGESKPDQDRLPKLARLLKTTVASLLDTSERPTFVADDGVYSLIEPGGERHDVVRQSIAEYEFNAEPAATRGKLPLISDVQAGEWSDIVDQFQPGDAEDWLPCPFNHGPNAFILRVAGYSMHNPSGELSFAPGEFIAVDPQVEPHSRKLVVARVDHEERATFKQLIIEPDGTHLLQALNPSWPNRILPLPPGSRIVGVVIGKWTAL